MNFYIRSTILILITENTTDYKEGIRIIHGCAKTKDFSSFE